MFFFKPEVLKNGNEFKLRKTLRESALYRLTLAGHKMCMISKRNDENTIKITGVFPENACFENPNKTFEFMKFRRFAVFLIR